MADDIVLVKLGGSLLTEKKSQTPKIRENNIKKISEIISKINKKIILIHGAGSYAHPLVKKYNIHKGLDGTQEQIRGITKAKEQVRELNSILCKNMKENGLLFENIIPSQKIKIDNHNQPINFPKEDFDEILAKGKIAITFGDIVDTENEDVGILSGDTLLLKLAELYKPKRTFFIMDYPGIVKGKLDDENLTIYDEIDSRFVKNITIQEDNERPDVTGGLLNKIKCALQIAKVSECWISGLDNFEDCLNDNPIGTKVIV